MMIRGKDASDRSSGSPVKCKRWSRMISAPLQHAQPNLRGDSQKRELLPLMLAVWLAVCVLCGCTYRDPSVEILEGELRWMEDQLYLLEDELARTSVALNKCRRSDGGCGGPCTCDRCAPAREDGYTIVDDGSREDGYSIVEDDTSSRRPSDADAERRYDSDSRYEVVPSDPQPTPAPPLTRPESEVPPELQLDTQPRIELPDVPDPSSFSPGAASDSSGEFQVIDPVTEMPEVDGGAPPQELNARPLLLPNAPVPGTRPTIDQGASANNGASPQISDLSIRLQAFAEADPEEDTGLPEVENDSASDMVDAHVTHIVAKGRLARGKGFEEEQTNADVLVLVEPRNADGNYVALAGPTSIVVLDAEKRGEEARVARWDFDAAETRRRLRESAAGRGAHFSLDWPGATPQSEKLYLFVRYVTVEGRKLEADVPLETNSSGATNGQWRVVKPKSRLATWNRDLKVTPLKRTESQIRLEPIPGSSANHTGDGQPEPSSAWSERSRSHAAIKPQPAAEEPSGEPEMPVLINDKDRLEWSPDR